MIRRSVANPTRSTASPFMENARASAKESDNSVDQETAWPVQAPALPETCAIEGFRPDQVKTTAFKFQRPAGTPAGLKPAQYCRTAYWTSHPCPAESRRRYSYSAPQACLHLASRSGPPILM